MRGFRTVGSVGSVMDIVKITNGISESYQDDIDYSKLYDNAAKAHTKHHLIAHVSIYKNARVARDHVFRPRESDEDFSFYSSSPPPAHNTKPGAGAGASHPAESRREKDG